MKENKYLNSLIETMKAYCDAVEDDELIEDKLHDVEQLEIVCKELKNEFEFIIMQGE